MEKILLTQMNESTLHKVKNVQGERSSYQEENCSIFIDYAATVMTSLAIVSICELLEDLILLSKSKKISRLKISMHILI